MDSCGSSNDCKFLQLSDCIMLTLLSYLDSTSLYNLSRTCHHFRNIVEDLTLWRFIDARADPNTSEKVEYCIDKIHERTTTVMFRAKNSKCGFVPYSFFQSIANFDNLSVLALENQCLNAKRVSMNNFPNCLEELSFKKTYIKNARFFFRYSKDNMKNLRVLILDECSWVESCSLMSVAKYKNLQIISAIKCEKLAANAVPYLSIARHACKNLKIFDCRFTALGHSLLTIFYKLPSLLAFYFQNLHTYYLDYAHKTVGAVKGGKFNDCTINENIFDIETLSDNSLMEYFRLGGADAMCELPKSVLYQDPYGDCVCKYDDKFPENICTESEKLIEEEVNSNLSDYPNLLGYSKYQGFVCSRHRRKLNREASSDSSLQSFLSVNVDEFDSDSESDDSSNSSSDDECCMLASQEGDKSVIIVKVVARPQSGAENQISWSERMIPPGVNPFLPSNQGFQINIEALDNQEVVASNSVVNLAKRRLAQAGGSNKKIKISLKSPANSDDAAGPSTSSNSINDNPSTSSAEQNGSSSQMGPSAFSRPERKPSLIMREIRIDASPEARPCQNFEPHVIRRAVVNIRNSLHNHAKQPKKVPLRRLSLRGFRKITDVSLHYIKDLNLDLLDLTYTSVTEEGIEKFLIDNPSCRIIHPKYCVCKPRVPLFV